MWLMLGYKMLGIKWHTSFCIHSAHESAHFVFHLSGLIFALAVRIGGLRARFGSSPLTSIDTHVYICIYLRMALGLRQRLRIALVIGSNASRRAGCKVVRDAVVYYMHQWYIQTVPSSANACSNMCCERMALCIARARMAGISLGRAQAWGLACADYWNSSIEMKRCICITNLTI